MQLKNELQSAHISAQAIRILWGLCEELLTGINEEGLSREEQIHQVDVIDRLGAILDMFKQYDVKRRRLIEIRDSMKDPALEGPESKEILNFTSALNTMISCYDGRSQSLAGLRVDFEKGINIAIGFILTNIESMNKKLAHTTADESIFSPTKRRLGMFMEKPQPHKLYIDTSSSTRKRKPEQEEATTLEKSIPS